MLQYRIRIRGRGFVTLQWEAGAETEERVQCVVVAERNVLKKALERQPQLFALPHSLNIEVTYEEPQRLPDSDQLRYLPSKTITTRDLHSGLFEEELLYNPGCCRVANEMCLGCSNTYQADYDSSSDIVEKSIMRWQSKAF